MQDSLFYINRQLISHNPDEKVLETYQNVTLEDKYHAPNYAVLSK